MKRARTLTLLVLPRSPPPAPGATRSPAPILRGPGALAVFDGIVAHESGLAPPVPRRGQRARGRAAAHRHDRQRDRRRLRGSSSRSPSRRRRARSGSRRPIWATALWSAPSGTPMTGPTRWRWSRGGSNVVELDGHVERLPSRSSRRWRSGPGGLGAPTGAEILSITWRSRAGPVDDGTAAPGVGRFVVGLSGGAASRARLSAATGGPDGRAIGAPTVDRPPAGLRSGLARAGARRRGRLRRLARPAPAGGTLGMAE